jgi:signal transduction histidine kinase
MNTYTKSLIIPQNVISRRPYSPIRRCDTFAPFQPRVMKPEHAAGASGFQRSQADLGEILPLIPPSAEAEAETALDLRSLFGEADAQVERVPFDLTPVLRLAAWIVAPIVAAKEIQLRMDYPESGLMAQGDDVQVQQVVESLLYNAIKFSPSGSTITLGARSEGGQLRVWVDDAGPGVQIAEQPQLFAQYGRTSTRPAEEENDGRLSLYVCRRIVQGQHGMITMRNNEPNGAHFEFCLPTATEAPMAENPAVAQVA